MEGINANKEIKTIIACADIHIRNFKRNDEYIEQLNKFIEDCKNIVTKHASPEEVRIVIAGDLLHNKLDISSEAYFLAAWFLKKLDDICPVIIIAGNHDLNMKNTERLDPISAIFSMCDFKQTVYLDKLTDYESACVQDNNIVWCLYSCFDNLSRPNIEEAKIQHKDCTFVALFHDTIAGAKMDTAYAFDNGKATSLFEDIDFGILGHIHRRQCLKHNGIPLVYCGSLIQQDNGENVNGHGYVVWNVDEQEYEEKNIENPDNGFYVFSINSKKDIEEDLEELVNF